VERPAGFYEHRKNRRARQNFAQQIEAFWNEFLGQLAYARNVTARPVQTVDEPEIDRVSTAQEDYGYGSRSILGR
jgi:hypothetical protein